ncbi:MAG: hypothetical protein RL518_1328 [Pseudomonadota bacterium]
MHPGAIKLSAWSMTGAFHLGAPAIQVEMDSVGSGLGNPAHTRPLPAGRLNTRGLRPFVSIGSLEQLAYLLDEQCEDYNDKHTTDEACPLRQRQSHTD